MANEKFLHRLPILIFVALLTMVYIGLGFRVQQRHMDLDKLNAQIKELRTISVATTSLRTATTRRENIDTLLVKYNIPLIDNPNAPFVLK